MPYPPRGSSSISLSPHSAPAAASEERRAHIPSPWIPASLSFPRPASWGISIVVEREVLTMALACTAASRLVHPCMGMGMVSKQQHPPRTPPPPSSCCGLHLHILHHRPVASSHLARHSVDVTKDDKPLEPPVTAASPQQSEEEEEEDGGPKLDPRRLEEKFAVLNTGIHECRSCGYRYDQSAGDPSYPVPPGLPFAQLPDDWRCPTCGAAQSFFESKSVEIAGFAQNQQFGLGGNSLTSGQKGLLIYGSLLVGFLFFISGYFLQ